MSADLSIELSLSLPCLLSCADESSVFSRSHGDSEGSGHGRTGHFFGLKNNLQIGVESWSTTFWYFLCHTAKCSLFQNTAEELLFDSPMSGALWMTLALNWVSLGWYVFLTQNLISFGDLRQF